MPFDKPREKVTTRHYILMLTKETARIEKSIRNMCKEADVIINVHNNEVATNAITQGGRFFAAAFGGGMRLNSASAMAVSCNFPNLNPATTLELARKAYGHLYAMAFNSIAYSFLIRPWNKIVVQSYGYTFFTGWIPVI